MNTRYLFGAVLACTVGALSSERRPCAGRQARAGDARRVRGRCPRAGGRPGRAGVTVAEERLIAAGFRASKLLKQDVFNDKGEKIGRIDDLVIAPDGTLSIAVINVGGFLGLGDHRVAVPVRQFAHIAPKAVLPNASKDQLKALPKFEYVA